MAPSEPSASSVSSDSDSSELVTLRAGVLAFCRFGVRGVVKATRVLVVHAGAQQTIVAAPSECGIAPSGDWVVLPNEQAVPSSFSCGCTEKGVISDLVFYSVDSHSLSTVVLPEAVKFTTSTGVVCRPRTQNMMALYYGAAQEKAPRMQTLSADGVAGERYHEVRLSDTSAPFLCNSVLLIPDFLTKAECHLLMEAADCRRAALTALEEQQRGVAALPAKSLEDLDSGLSRLSMRHLAQDAQQLSLHILQDRVLPFLEQQLPEVAHHLFGRSAGLKEMAFSFSPNEPAVNRYSVGGEFKVHTDCYAVTVNVLLSEPESFTGGGTAFWQQGQDAATSVAFALEPSIDDALLLQPRQGTGVLFNGNVHHSGRPVQSGTRHLYVASFNLD
eukprot:TRINITY_DN51977_c0_g1_i1.p1 TRINITY_DN51977_c0_g1~~TRINITY_DN51977_c0_g1_i1.p1  ORF type:complete len:387 (-),score=53.35 TRINITY_DN51977_c0_g1_i1:14-1174(-)